MVVGIKMLAVEREVFVFETYFEMDLTRFLKTGRVQKQKGKQKAGIRTRADCYSFA